MTLQEFMQKSNTNLTLMALPELETLALQVKIAIARHYAGEKLDVNTFMQLKGIETIYNVRSWNEADKAGPARLNKLAKKAVK